jgi:hypothetical protein
MDPSTRLEENLQGLVMEIPSAREAIERLGAEGWTPTWCGPVQRGLYAWLHLQVEGRVQERFGLAAELLVLVCKRHVQYKWLVESNRRPVHLRQRVEPGLVVVIDPVEGLGQRLEGMVPPLCAVPYPATGGITLHEALAGQLSRANPFDVRHPVVGNEVVGRDRLINDIVHDLSQHPAIALYGLRKMGKTTAAMAVQGRLDPELRLPTVDDPLPWLVQRVDAQRYEAEGIPALCASLARGLMERLGLPPASGPPDLGTVVGLALRRADRLLLIVDELDLLFNPRSGYARDVLAFLALLRGLLMEHPDGLRLLFIGREPGLLASAVVMGESNPMMSLWRPVWVGPLSREATGALLHRLGKKAGLYAGHQTRDLAFAYTGGHPLLARLFGSAIWRRAHPLVNPTTERRVDMDPLALAAQEDCRGDFDFTTIGEEVKVLLETIDPAALALLRDRCNGRLGSAPSASLKLLGYFGLLPPDGGPIATWLREAFAQLPARGQAA